MTVIDASNKSDVSIIILNEKTWAEFYCVVLPTGMSARKRKQAENRLISSGFKTDYAFEQIVTNRRSLSLAKAQAASMVKRISEKTGLVLELQHQIHVSG